MNIQSNINQGLSLASMLVMMNPTIKQKSETNLKLKKLAQEESVLGERYKLAIENVPDLTALENIEQGLERVSEEQFKLKPTKESYAKNLGARYGQYEAIPSENQQTVSEFRAKLKAEQQRSQEALAAEQERGRFTRELTRGIYGVEADPRGTPEQLAERRAQIRAPKPNVGEETF